MLVSTLYLQIPLITIETVVLVI